MRSWCWFRITTMEPPHRYSRSPLTEALIDLRCKVPEETTLERLASLQQPEHARYPIRQERALVEAELTTGRRIGASASQTHLGYIFWSADERQAFQARLDGFTFSRLAPYDRWNTFRDEAQRLWTAYRDLVQPDVTRVAVRYINRFELPIPLRDFKDYLRTVPEVSPDLPQGLSGYLMRLQIPQEDLDAMLVLSEALAPSSTPETTAAIVLDLDLFRMLEAPLADDEIWSLLEQFRSRKNEAFEACITDQTRELIT
jgi:uncharacterized protein (TIGR04255 family)